MTIQQKSKTKNSATRPQNATGSDRRNRMQPLNRHRVLRLVPGPYSSLFLFLDRIASRYFLLAPASRQRRFSSALFTISGGTTLGVLEKSSQATNVTYAVVVCVRSPVSGLSQ